MREIKFRAWDKEKNRMYIPNEKYNKYLCCSGIEMLVSDFFGDDNFELMQYTGLKDKNGKEIYEGDVVNNINSKRQPCMEVFWSQLKVGFRLRYKNIWNNKKEVLYKALGDTNKLEVIGNIYENPELLVKKNK